MDTHLPNQSCKAASNYSNLLHIVGHAGAILQKQTSRFLVTSEDELKLSSKAILSLIAVNRNEWTWGLFQAVRSTIMCCSQSTTERKLGVGNLPLGKCSKLYWKENLAQFPTEKNWRQQISIHMDIHPHRSQLHSVLQSLPGSNNQTYPLCTELLDAQATGTSIHQYWCWQNGNLLLTLNTESFSSSFFLSPGNHSSEAKNNAKSTRL